MLARVATCDSSTVTVDFNVILNITSLPVALEGLPKLARGLVTDGFNLNIPFDMVVIRRRNNFVDLPLEKWSSFDRVLISIERGRLHVESLGVEG